MGLTSMDRSDRILTYQTTVSILPPHEKTHPTSCQVINFPMRYDMEFMIISSFVLVDQFLNEI
jgi:hypothetical protein